MKLKFIRPKDRIKLTSNGTLTTTLKAAKDNDYAYQFKEVIDAGVVELPKGTLLEVSQIYLRNRGYFSDSITFKVPMAEEGLFESLLKGKIEETINGRSGINARMKQAKEALKSLQESGNTAIIRELDWQSGTHKVIRTWTTKEAMTDVQFREWQNECMREGRGGSYSMDVRSWLERTIKSYENDIESLTQRTKGAYGTTRNSLRNSVIRILLPDIEEWDVRIVEKEEK